MEESTRRILLQAQRNEITEHHIYSRLAAREKDADNRKVLERIAGEELDHYHHWRSLTGSDVGPAHLKVWCYGLVAWLLGITFTVKLMEAGEGQAHENYSVLKDVPRAGEIAASEDEHEERLIEMLDEERLKYTGAMVLGLNDALVELTGALAGFTLAFREPRLVAVAGLITGISASLSMAGSEYLAVKSEEGDLQPGKAAFYTGLAYVLTVGVLIAPYLLLGNIYACLGVMIGSALLIIALFNFYVAVAKDLQFGKRFLEMAGISLGVATLTFGIGALVRQVLPVEV